MLSTLMPSNFFETTASSSHSGLSMLHTMALFFSFFMWIKLFYFLRIFRDTGFFVNMFIKVIYEIRVFGLLYVLILCCFAFTFYI